MLKTFGKMPTTLPPGYCKAVRFPVLMKMDQETGDGRFFESDGGGVRELPLSIMCQFVTEMGHFLAEVTGTLFEVSLDPDTGVAEGAGFLLDDENGRRHMRLAYLGALRKNSVDLADIAYRIEWAEDYSDYSIRFTKWNIAATTGVNVPAFDEAHMVVEGDVSDDELVASLIGDDPMEPIVFEFDEIVANLVLPKSLTDELSAIAEITASGSLPSWDDFHRPEADKLTKLTILADGTAYGHLGAWNSCHDGIEGQCLTIPRPDDGYASFNKAGVLTDRGMVQTGPIFLYGGHRKIGNLSPDAAYGGIENAWGDFRITAGVLGPWVSGRVRPGVDEEKIYAARASRISGHWVGGKLKAIVSVNAEGFEVPGDSDDTLARDLAAGFAVHVDETGVYEMVASFPGCAQSDSPAGGDVTVAVELSDADRQEIIDAVLAKIYADDPDRGVSEGSVVVALTDLAEQHADDLALAALLEDEDDTVDA